VYTGRHALSRQTCPSVSAAVGSGWPYPMVYCNGHSNPLFRKDWYQSTLECYSNKMEALSDSN